MADHSPWGLARLAGVASPDTLDSPGAIWLLRVARESVGIAPDAIRITADRLVPQYTREIWRVFVDLAAYNENVTDVDGPITDMTQAAGVALHLIAERLLRVLIEERA